MQKIIFVKEENRKHALVRLTLHLEQSLIDDLMEVAWNYGISVRVPEKVIETFLRLIVEHVREERG